jgi:hypothetical protein
MWWSLSRSALIGPGVPVREATRPGLDASLHEDGSLEPRDEEVGALDDGLHVAGAREGIGRSVSWLVAGPCHAMPYRESADLPLP